MTQELYQNAMKFAGEKHHNQHVPGTNINYLLHLSNVAMEVLLAYQMNPDFDLNFAVQMAILHDTIEDTETSYEEIKKVFDEPIAKGVLALTKDHLIPKKEDRMLDSLIRINRLSKEVSVVKLADRITNLQTPPKHWSKEKISKYLKEARKISHELVNKNEFLENRLKEKIKIYAMWT